MITPIFVLAVNEFKQDSGGTIRIIGLLQQLVNLDRPIYLLSNASGEQLLRFPKEIQHIHINHIFGREEKRKFQGRLGVFPNFLMKRWYNDFLMKFKTISKTFALETHDILTCEYLDNSLGYFLKSNGLIKGYVNDLHGVATLEFKFQAQFEKKLVRKTSFWLKYLVSDLLDAKVCNHAKGMIYASESMKSFFQKTYPTLENTPSVILPYLLSDGFDQVAIDKELLANLGEKFEIGQEDKVILFAGGFKQTGGIQDLVTAFENVYLSNKDIKLILIGDGPTFKAVQEQVENSPAKNNIYLVGRTPYHHLRTYQELADILVCPDRQNVYSELIIHVKYLDALASGKLVINGSFASVMEINQEEKLSLTFKPSNIDSLTSALTKALHYQETLSKKYEGNLNYVRQHLTYASQTKSFQSLSNLLA